MFTNLSGDWTDWPELENFLEETNLVCKHSTTAGVAGLQPGRRQRGTIFPGKLSTVQYLLVVSILFPHKIFSAGGCSGVESSHMLMPGNNCDWWSEISNIPSKLSSSSNIYFRVLTMTKMGKDLFFKKCTGYLMRYLMLLKPSLVNVNTWKYISIRLNSGLAVINSLDISPSQCLGVLCLPW